MAPKRPSTKRKKAKTATLSDGTPITKMNARKKTGSISMPPKNAKDDPNKHSATVLASKIKERQQRNKALAESI